MAVYLETPRTFMREILGNDFDFLLRMMSDPEVMRYYPAPYTARDVREFINRMRTRYREDGCGLWMLVDRGSGDAVRLRGGCEVAAGDPQRRAGAIRRRLRRSP